MNPTTTPTVRHRHRPMLFTPVWMAALCGLAACSGSLLPKPASMPARHALDAGAAASSMPIAGPDRGPSTGRTGGASSSGTLAVEPLRAAPGYDSRRMVYQGTPGQLDAFAFHEWVAPPAEMLAPLLVRALQDASGGYTVLPSPSAAVADWRLETQLLRLLQDFTVHPSQLRLSVRIVLLDGHNRRVLGWREVDISLPTTADDPVAGAATAQAAALQATRAVAAFCAEQLRAGPAPAR